MRDLRRVALVAVASHNKVMACKSHEISTAELPEHRPQSAVRRVFVSVGGLIEANFGWREAGRQKNVIEVSRNERESDLFCQRRSLTCVDAIHRLKLWTFDSIHYGTWMR